MQDTFAATLHYQLAYRLQNHAFDKAVPDIAQSNDALLKKDFKSKHFEKMESLVTKGNHPPVTYGGTFMFVLIARKKKALKKTIPRERKNPPNKSSKKVMKQEIQKLIF